VVVRRTIISHTAACYVLADSSKLGLIAVRRVCPLDQLTAVLTDDEADQALVAGLEGAGATILVAPVEPQLAARAG
jgi:DeoR family transcriptional regulator, fructose operon transcriptional repressor